jgi:hypothetical protein
MSLRADSYIFSEYNAFIKCKNVVDDKTGGVCKSYNNAFLSSSFGSGNIHIVDNKTQTVSSGNKYANFDTNSSLSYIPSGNYIIQESIGEMKAVVMAYAGVQKSNIVAPDSSSASVIPANRYPTSAVVLDYSKSLNKSYVTSLSGSFDNIVFNVTKSDNSSLTVGGYTFELQYVNNVPYLGLYLGDSIEFIVGLYDEGFSFVDSRMNKIDYTEAPAIGFDGKEKLGSARGYIWSRSLPLMLENPLVGHGADTFFAEFPQGDLLAKLYSYGTTQMIVDKPHNLYLQIGINHGVIALLAFVAMMMAYLIDSFKLYALRGKYSVQQVIGAAIALAVIGYLGAGFFNDSIVSVAPIFWALFGVGIAVNQLNKKDDAAELPET